VRATLASVARLAGVSTSTASRAITGDPKVSPETRQRVLDAADSLRYRPNRIASGLRTRRTGLVAFAVPDLRDLWWTTMTEALQREARADGVHLLSHQTTQSDQAVEASFVDAVLEHGFDGVIIGGRADAGDHVRHLAEAGTAAVTLGCVHPGGALPAVLPDHEAATRLLTRHLTALGHTKLACVLDDLDDQPSRDAYAGFVHALAEAGAPLRQEWTLRGPRDPGFGAAAVACLLGLEEPPTAVVMTSWRAGIGAVRRLMDDGIGLGSDFSLVLAEGPPVAHEWFTDAAITGVASQVDELARLAWRALGQQLDGEARPVSSVSRLAPRLVVGTTSGPVHSRE
jgi:LacI family transcriptional regulator